jgi:hypothetical protein
MNTKLVGAIDAVILGLTAAVLVALVLTLVTPVSAEPPAEPVKQEREYRVLTEQPATTPYL